MSGREFPVSIPHGATRAFESTSSVLVRAAGHARNRILHSCEAIAWIGGLALDSKSPRTPVFSIKAAEVQDATAGKGEQAAHILPGQILIDGKPPWALSPDVKVKVAWLARFMVTAPVPTPFNVADSAAEKSGLKEAFRLACELAWGRVSAGERDLTATYADFLADADRAFQKAELGKRTKRASASSAGDQRTGDERFVESVVLRMYLTHGVTAKMANDLFPLTSFS